MSGYDAMHPVGIEVRADNLEIAAGWADRFKARRELDHALATLDASDPSSLRWLAVCIAANLDWLEAEERNPVVTP